VARCPANHRRHILTAAGRHPDLPFQSLESARSPRPAPSRPSLLPAAIHIRPPWHGLAVPPAPVPPPRAPKQKLRPG